jgi:hypothetical protein
MTASDPFAGNISCENPSWKCKIILHSILIATASRDTLSRQFDFGEDIMLIRIMACIIIAGFCVTSSAALSLSVKPDSGAVLVWRQKSGSWVAVKDSAALSYGDSLYCDDQYTGRVQCGRGCSILVRGELRLCILGADTAAVVRLDQGSLFFKRDADAEFANVKIVLRGCTFTPLGTAAGIKFTKQGEPTVAVMTGSVKLDPPKGEAVVVTPGNFGTYDPVAGTVKQGALAPEVVAFLERWSGTKLDQSATAPAQAASAPGTAKKVSQDAPSQAQTAAPAAAAPVTQPVPAAGSVSQASVEKKEAAKEEKPKEEKKPEAAGAAGNATPGITWEVSAGSVTVDGKQWTRIAISPDIPIWKFGVCLDIEAFIDADGKFSDKGWQFDNENALQSILRKIRYIRFGHESDQLFVKFGGLSNVTLGYGFVVDRFTNMLHYPDRKLIGLQFDLNNITPLGVTLQTLVPDFNDFKNDGGIVAGWLAVCPMKMTSIPLLSKLSIGATYATDLNEYADTRTWHYLGNLKDKNGNGTTDWDFAFRQAHNQQDSAAVQRAIVMGIIDNPATTKYQTPDTVYRDSSSRYAEFGGDIGLPLITTDFLGLDVYGQAAVVADTVMFKKERTGWGFGAPGVALRAGPLSARVEYRHTQGRFLPGYFGPYYFDERLRRNPVETRSQSVPSRTLNGIFGEAGFNIVNVFLLDATYQYLKGKNNAKDQRLEASGGLGDALLKRIPKITKAEVYYYKTGIGSTNMGIGTPTVTYDRFFDKTPAMYYGYRIGIGITQGASIILDNRYGYQWQGDKLVPNNNIILMTAITF